MSGAELRSFEMQFSVLSHEEQLSVIDFLINLMKDRHDETACSKSKNGAEQIFALMDENPVHSGGQKWTREELHER